MADEPCSVITGPATGLPPMGCRSSTPLAVSHARMVRSTSVLMGTMPRRPVPVTATKAEKFQRLANLRTNLIIDGLRKLGSLSNNNRYDYSEDEAKRIVSTIEEAVAD